MLITYPLGTNTMQAAAEPQPAAAASCRAASTQLLDQPDALICVDQAAHAHPEESPGASHHSHGHSGHGHGSSSRHSSQRARNAQFGKSSGSSGYFEDEQTQQSGSRRGAAALCGLGVPLRALQRLMRSLAPRRGTGGSPVATCSSRNSRAAGDAPQHPVPVQDRPAPSQLHQQHQQQRQLSPFCLHQSAWPLEKKPGSNVQGPRRAWSGSRKGSSGGSGGGDAALDHLDFLDYLEAGGTEPSSAALPGRLRVLLSHGGSFQAAALDDGLAYRGGSKRLMSLRSNSTVAQLREQVAASLSFSGPQVGLV